MHRGNLTSVCWKGLPLMVPRTGIGLFERPASANRSLSTGDGTDTNGFPVDNGQLGDEGGPRSHLVIVRLGDVADGAASTRE